MKNNGKRRLPLGCLAAALVLGLTVSQASAQSTYFDTEGRLPAQESPEGDSFRPVWQQEMQRRQQQPAGKDQAKPGQTRRARGEASGKGKSKAPQD